ncbi:MAG TPA: rod shape-determining protein MreC [Steroidobacteraceae bacterium]|nr:rod shape-determining protein MreC [Steroidobacteraceae bacterium]
MAFGTPGSRSQARGGPSPGFRFTLYAVLSFVVMFLDQRHGWLEQVRYGLQALTYPVQLAVSSPASAWKWLHEVSETRDALRAENARLRDQDRLLALRAMRYEALARENGELRGLRDALPPVAERWLAAELVIQPTPLRQRFLINRGSTNGVFKGQAVLDDKGIIGQTTHVGPFSAEVILITDPEHAIPVQIERTGLRTIAVGAGDTTSLALPYLPGNADVKAGDMLMTSGLGGVFPAGYPVARVTEVHRDAVQPLAQVRALPFATVDTDSELMLVWFRDDHPASPTPASTATGDLRTGNPKLQPQAAPPPRPKAPATETSPAAPPPAGTGARNSEPSSGTVNPAAAAPSKSRAPAAVKSPDGSTPAKPANSKDSVSGDNPRAATPREPAPPATPEPSPDATPRNP